MLIIIILCLTVTYFYTYHMATDRVLFFLTYFTHHIITDLHLFYTKVTHRMIIDLHLFYTYVTHQMSTDLDLFFLLLYDIRLRVDGAQGLHLLHCVREPLTESLQTGVVLSAQLMYRLQCLLTLSQLTLELLPNLAHLVR